MVFLLVFLYKLSFILKQREKILMNKNYNWFYDLMLIPANPRCELLVGFSSLDANSKQV